MDPKERQARIESYGRAYDRLVEALASFPREAWQFKPAPDSWSIHEQLVHLADSEAVSYARVRRGLAEPGSQVFAYDQDRWAVAMDYHAQSWEDAVELFKRLRQMSYHLIKNLPPEVWSQTILHPENGEMTLDDWLVIYDDHVLGHIQQMQECCQTWQAAR
ncbi:MAG TPA: DinB family protein [Aggregatilineaceae bacterium]|nr:DinB family protein [Aggregatilineaceae bacterium]